MVGLASRCSSLGLSSARASLPTLACKSFSHDRDWRRTKQRRPRTRRCPGLPSRRRFEACGLEKSSPSPGQRRRLGHARHSLHHEPGVMAGVARHRHLGYRRTAVTLGSLGAVCGIQPRQPHTLWAERAWHPFTARQRNGSPRRLPQSVGSSCITPHIDEFEITLATASPCFLADGGVQHLVFGLCLGASQHGPALSGDAADWACRSVQCGRWTLVRLAAASKKAPLNRR